MTITSKLISKIKKLTYLKIICRDSICRALGLLIILTNFTRIVSSRTVQTGFYKFLMQPMPSKR